MTIDLTSDAVNWVAFFLGQMLFILKRAGSAIRNPGTAIKTRTQFVMLNWDTILIRAAMEFPFFYAWRHYSVAAILGYFGWNMPGSFTFPNNILTAFLLGYAADSLMDWISMSSKLPEFLQTWLKENVPVLQGDQLQRKLEEAADKTKSAEKETANAVKAIEDAKEIKKQHED